MNLLTPVNLVRMRPWLDSYPNQQLAQPIEDGFAYGFKVPPFEGTCCARVDNLKSVSLHSGVVFKKIMKEIEKGRVAGPCSGLPFENFHLSPVGLVLKKKPNSYRIIHHLSFPFGSSLNDCIDKDLSSVSYSTFDQAVYLVHQFGPSALIAKANVEAAFRLFPINPDGFSSLGFQFDGIFFVDKCLPIGFSLSCFYFEAFASFLEWVVV